MAYKLVNMLFVLDLIYSTYHKLVISNIILNLYSLPTELYSFYFYLNLSKNAISDMSLSVRPNFWRRRERATLMLPVLWCVMLAISLVDRFIWISVHSLRSFFVRLGYSLSRFSKNISFELTKVISTSAQSPPVPALCCNCRMMRRSSIRSSRPSERLIAAFSSSVSLSMLFCS